MALALGIATATPGCVPAPRSFRLADDTTALRVAVLPLANYSPTRDATACVAPVLNAELSTQSGFELVEAGRVEAALEREPWLLLDRIPPDLVDRFGTELGAQALLVGSLLSYGYRDSGGERIPQVSLSLRLVETPGGRVLWSAVHSRDGADGEWMFGMGRVHSLEQLTMHTLHEMLKTLPAASDSSRAAAMARKGTGT
jgi:hypothetical protein